MPSMAARIKSALVCPNCKPAKAPQIKGDGSKAKAPQIKGEGSNIEPPAKLGLKQTPFDPGTEVAASLSICT